MTAGKTNLEANMTFSRPTKI